MRISKIAVLIGIVILISVPALAFYPNGTINRDITYDYIKLLPQPYSIRVSGTLYNRTSQPIKFNGVIKFVTIHQEVLNSATIYETIPPLGSIQFDRRLEKNNFKQIQHCYKLEWDVKDYSHASDRRKAPPNTPEQKSIGTSSTRASDSYISVTGKGNHNSNQFKLKTGLYIAKVSHTGKHHCGIKLLHGDGTFAELITNGIGYIVESKALRIDEDGYYLLDISADGDWTVNMEYQEPKTVQQEETTDQSTATEIGDSRGSTVPVVIKLKNGRTMNADSYWEAGDKLKVSIYGGIMTVDKMDVQEIIFPTPSNPPLDEPKPALNNADQPDMNNGAPSTSQQEIIQKLEKRQQLARELEKAKEKEAELDRAIEAEKEKRRKFEEGIDAYLKELDRKIKN